MGNAEFGSKPILGKYSASGMNGFPSWRGGHVFGKPTRALPQAAARRDDLCGVFPEARLSAVNPAPAGTGHPEHHPARPPADPAQTEMRIGGRVS